MLLFFVRILFAKSIALSCGVNVPMLDLLLVIPILWILVMLPMTIGGFGVQEASYALLMGLVGVGPAVAVSMSLIEHVVARAASLLACCSSAISSVGAKRRCAMRDSAFFGRGGLSSVD